MQTFSKNHSNFSLGYHIVWCTKYRHQVLRDAVEDQLKQIVRNVCYAKHWQLLAFEVMPDHAHLFVQAGPHIAPAVIAKTLKSVSALQLFRLFPKLKKSKFWGSGLWSRGTYYSSASHISATTVQRYIETQKFRG